MRSIRTAAVVLTIATDGGAGGCTVGLQGRSAVSSIKGMIAKVKRAMCHILIGRFLGLFCLLSLYAPMASAQTAPDIAQAFSSSLTAIPSEKLAVSGAFYVPAYSSVSMSQGKVRANFSVTLSIHNASETRPLVLRRIVYFDTSGKMVETYLKTPVALKPFSSIEVFVPVMDARGGIGGANFVVDWAADGEIAEPVVEALMFGDVGNGHYALISQGRPIRVIGKN
jgi:hypothetical protein